MAKKMVSRFPDYVWYCVDCHECLSDQDGFNDNKFTWKCTHCNYKNSISKDNLRKPYEIDDNIITQYVDKDQFYRFSTPFLLRAQNSSNRTGYGWEWDWSGGYGDYTEGTLYGETTDYFFVGAYISSIENYYYESGKRNHYLEVEPESKSSF